MSRYSKADRSDGSGRSLVTSRLVHNAVALMISSGGSAVLGLAFWGIATHLATAAAVGRTAAAITAMILLASLSQMGFGTIFERFLPVAQLQTRNFVVRAYLMCITFAFIATSIYAFSGLAQSFFRSRSSLRTF